MNLSIIEQLFRSTVSIQFYIAFEPTETPVVQLVVTNPADATNAYVQIKKYFTSDTTLVFKERNKRLDIAIRDPVSLEEINIRNLSFDKEQFDYYCGKHSPNEPFMLMIGYYQSNYLILIYPEEEPNPIRIQKYKME